MKEITLDEFVSKLAGKRIAVKGVCAAPPSFLVEVLGQVYRVRVK
ncbi:MAG: hypothetical protein ACO2OQ_02935 [Thermofilaceae archaeon]|jgi:hypothetical protein